MFYGIENESIINIKKKISLSKKTKGRGLLLSFHDHNEENRVPKLIKAVKLGFKIGLVSDAGTPTISDPGYSLLKEARK